MSGATASLFLFLVRSEAAEVVWSTENDFTTLRCVRLHFESEVMNLA